MNYMAQKWRKEIKAIWDKKTKEKENLIPMWSDVKDKDRKINKNAESEITENICKKVKY